MKNLFFLLLACVLLTQFSCKPDNDCETCGCPTCDDFDKSALLTNYADSLIIPSYKVFLTTVSSLKTSYNSFTNSPSESTLEELRSTFKTSYHAYQTITPFDFGPAFGSYAMEGLNLFPTNADVIEENAKATSFDLNNGNNVDAIGYPALDYLFYSNTVNDTIISLFSTDNFSQNRIDYGTALIAQIEGRANYIYNTWTNSYRATFIASTGSDPSSSISLLVNKYNESYEEAKNFKVGIPSGRKSVLGSQFTEKVEGLYSSTSLLLLTKQLEVLENVYTGTNADGQNGTGLEDMLIAYQNAELDTKIKDKFTAATAQLELIETSIEAEIKSGSDDVGVLYDILQANVVNIKSDMPSILSVAITYQDGDGD